METEQRQGLLSLTSIWLKEIPPKQQAAIARVLVRNQAELRDYVVFRLRKIFDNSEDIEEAASELYWGMFPVAATGIVPDLERENPLWRQLQRTCNHRLDQALSEQMSANNAFARRCDRGVFRKLLGTPGELEFCRLAVEHSLLQRELSRRHSDLPWLVSMKMQGYSKREISLYFGIPQRTVQRRIAWIEHIFSG